VGPLRASDDLPRSGPRADINEAARIWLIGEACAKPNDCGYAHELWTLRLLADHAHNHGPGTAHACLAEIAASVVQTSPANQVARCATYLERCGPASDDDRKCKVIEVDEAA
jgi:hypothetical protein